MYGSNNIGATEERIEPKPSGRAFANNVMKTEAKIIEEHSKSREVIGVSMFVNRCQLRSPELKRLHQCCIGQEMEHITANRAYYPSCA